MIRDIGLTLFILLICPALPVILFDAGLMLATYLTHGVAVETITQYVRHRWWSVGIVVALQVGVIGLAVHFWWPIEWGG